MGALLGVAAVAAFAYGVAAGSFYHSRVAVLAHMLGLAAAIGAALLGGRGRGLLWMVGPLAAMAVVAQLIPFVGLDPGLYVAQEAGRGWLHVANWMLVAATVLVVVGLAREHPRLVAVRRSLLFLGFLVAGLWMLHASPDPHVDVVRLHEAAAADLLSGSNPYALSQPVADTGPGGMTWSSYTYPPMALLLQLPFHALGADGRQMFLLAMLVLAAAVMVVARRAGLPPAAADALALLALLHPKALFVLEHAWTEPLTAALVAVAAALHFSGRPAGAAVAFGLALGSKQTMLVAAPLLLLLPGFGVRRTAMAVGVAAATLVPFFLWSPDAFWEGVVRSHLDAPARLGDSNSVPAYLDRHGITWPLWLAFPLALAAGSTVAWLRRGSSFAPWMAIPVALGTLFLFGKQAFANYYWLVGVLCVLALAAMPISAQGTSADPASRSGSA